MARESGHESPLSLSDHTKFLLDQLAGEYGIVQDKIDKIAGFRFTIRGWSITLAIAFAFSANTLNLPPYWILSALLPVAAFLFMELSQRRNHDTLCARALRVEKRIWRTLRLSAPLGTEAMIGGMVPRLAHDLAEETQSVNRIKRWFQSKGYTLFYGLQILLVVAAAFWVWRFQVRTTEPDAHPSYVINNYLSPEARTTEGGPNGKAQRPPRKP